MKNLFRILLFVATTMVFAINTQVFAENHTKALKTSINDSVITAKIKSQFVANDTTKASSINVETKNGVVILSGTVDSESEAAAAIQIAASTVGVKEVDSNNLYIKAEVQQGKQTIRDSYITAKVKGRLIREKLMNNVEFPAVMISVETKDGIVYLSGTVEHEGQLKNAIELTKSVIGVKKVISKLTVAAG